MLVAYDSMTGNVKRFIHKLNMPAVQIGEDLVIDEDFILNYVYNRFCFFFFFAMYQNVF